jgi:predicted nucleic acid-binding protein
VEALFEHLGFALQSLPKEALFLAGKVFLQYKKNKGVKSNVLPDFLIGAHAAVSGYRLITRDKGRFSTYFRI